MSEKSAFERLAAIDVSKHIEKKNGLSYLSWAWAVDQLLRSDPSASWSFNDSMKFGETVMVSCTVTAFGKPMTMYLPVMDYRNKAISNPDAFAVNTAMMRCLVKAIALHGLGLYIYAGEDLPLEDSVQSPGVHKPTANEAFQPDEEEVKFLSGIVADIISLENDPAVAAEKFYGSGLDNDEKIYIWNELGNYSALRRKMKKINEELKQKEGI